MCENTSPPKNWYPLFPWQWKSGPLAFAEIRDGMKGVGSKQEVEYLAQTCITHICANADGHKQWWHQQEFYLWTALAKPKFLTMSNGAGRNVSYHRIIMGGAIHLPPSLVGSKQLRII